MGGGNFISFFGKAFKASTQKPQKIRHHSYPGSVGPKGPSTCLPEVDSPKEIDMICESSITSPHVRAGLLISNKQLDIKERSSDTQSGFPFNSNGKSKKPSFYMEYPHSNESAPSSQCTGLPVLSPKKQFSRMALYVLKEKWWISPVILRFGSARLIRKPP